MKNQLNEINKQLMDIEENPRFKQRKELVDEGRREIFQDKLKRFIAGQKYDFGFVAAASGFQTIRASTIPSDLSESSLDWALIDVPSRRLRKNIIDGISQLRQSKSPNLKGLRIKGRTTGDSTGLYDEVKDMVSTDIIVNNKPTKVFTAEHRIIGFNNKPFSELGDLSAIVFNEDKEMVGMLFAGCKVTGAGYFIYIKDLFNDIVVRTGAAGIRLPKT